MLFSPRWYKRLVFTIYLSLSSSFPLYHWVKLVWLSVCLVVVFITFHFNSIWIKKLNFYEIYQFKIQSQSWFRIYRCAIDFAILFSLFFRVYGFFSLRFACWNWLCATLFVLKSFHVRFISIVHVKLVQMFAHSSNFHSIFVWLAVSFLCVKFNKINWSLSVNLFIFQSENELVLYSRLCIQTHTHTLTDSCSNKPRPHQFWWIERNCWANTLNFIEASRMIGVVSTVNSSHTGKSANIKWIDQSLRLDGMETFENL